MKVVAVPQNVTARAHTIAGDAARLTASLTHSTTLEMALRNKQTIVRMMANLRELQAMNRPIVVAARELERDTGARKIKENA